MTQNIILCIRYRGERVAQLMCSIDLDTPGEAVVVGTKGSLKLPKPFYRSTKLETSTVSQYYLTLVDTIKVTPVNVSGGGGGGIFALYPPLFL